MTARDLLTQGYRALFLAEVDTPYLDAVVLLAHVMGAGKERLVASLPDEVETGIEDAYRSVLGRRASGTPVSYIRNVKEFYGLEFFVDGRVLVPRPDTETLVEKVLEIRRSDPRVLDVHDACTGSGCVAIALKRAAPELRVSASDVSRDAAEVFRVNERKLCPGQVPFYVSDLLDGVPGTFDLIAANPPYLSDAEVDDLRKIGWPEPEVSLRGGRDGTRTAALLIESAAGRLAPGGWLVLEAAPGQFLKLHALMDRAGFGCIAVDRDLAGRERVISGTLAAAAAPLSRRRLRGV
jgi:release factor glutamine methyltransferase